MDNLQYYLAMIAVLIAGFIIIKKVSSCIWNIIVAVIVLAVLLWGLTSLGFIDL